MLSTWIWSNLEITCPSICPIITEINGNETSIWDCPDFIVYLIDFAIIITSIVDANNFKQCIFFACAVNRFLNKLGVK